MAKAWVVLLATLGLMAVGCQQSPPLNRNSAAALQAADVQYHVNYLASDQLEGRLSGTAGGDLAANYIAAEFKRFQLEPAGGQSSYFQKFDFIGDLELGPNNLLRGTRGAADTTWKVGVDFMPAGFSATDTLALDSALVFAGYGISASEHGYDDYAGVAAAGKVVLIMRFSPGLNDPHSPFAKFEELRHKATTARQQGAAALLVTTGSLSDTSDALPRLRYDRAATDAGLPVIYVRRHVAEWLLAGSGQSLDALQQRINATRQPHSLMLPATGIHLQTDVRPVRRVAANIIGMLRGSDPQLQQQAVVVGAHYDHLGRSHEGSRSPDSLNGIHNGADDNASGTAGLLELAQYFAALPQKPRRSLVFIAFAAEELGLLGSAHYVNHPFVPLDKTIAMINMDMIGRLRDSTLVVQGVGTSPRWQPLLDSLQAGTHLQLKRVKDGQGPSDHASFYLKNIPVLFFFTDLHEDYHRVTDDADKINAPGEAEVLQLVAKTVTEIANSDSLPLFTKTDSERRAMTAFRVSLGTMPDYAAEVEGLKLSGVREGGPAARAGLQAGDIIIKFGEIDIKNIYDYTYALGQHAPGQEVEIVVLRNGAKMAFTVKLEASRRM
ncbi:MAG: M28 family peptidase [candidate division KSB1 bacterium]|nr:M28 family peptidase [candidate division KSB1 bacterium]MDZ7273852.1 M28 family peptidase [candidate division KSB1 bacterium]MDZ7286008.1 M28 family peptidase [candidate division KSB1 bacterium]MDZ7299040.1 M28 family peptidase [candidate division KSB1 bacterium]MDZ7307989.1 M28 family peptidase [candidate division KSB1 bacterium]